MVQKCLTMYLLGPITRANLCDHYLEALASAMSAQMEDTHELGDKSMVGLEVLVCMHCRWIPKYHSLWIQPHFV